MRFGCIKSWIPTYRYSSGTIKQKLLSMPPSYFSKKVSYKNQVYILSINMILIDKSNIITSDLEVDDIPIYNGNNCSFSHQYIQSLSSNESLELLKILAFRKIIGAIDNCTKTRIKTL